MSLIVHKLSKQFEQKVAVEELSFDLQPGHVMGLLGPNGAGKSTTIRMLTGYIPPTQGLIQICGYDIQKQPLLAKKRLGYLPEHNPLYPHTYVYEYLHFMARLHGVKARECRTSIAQVVEQCSLETVQNKKIGILSKGYQQRVGLAQALIHNPSVLILDEPTAGLDPHQIQQIRSLILKLSKEKAILFSTHIIPEIEAVCDQVIILHQGKVCLAAPLAAVTRQGQLQFIILFNESIPVAQLAGLPNVDQVELIGPNHYKLYVTSAQDIYENIFSFAKEKGVTVERLEQKKENLEAIFTRLTQNTTKAIAKNNTNIYNE